MARRVYSSKTHSWIMVSDAENRAMLNVAPTDMAKVHSSNPLHWPADKDCNISVAGLGSHRSYRRYPGKSFPSTALTCRIVEAPAKASGNGIATSL